MRAFAVQLIAIDHFAAFNADFCANLQRLLAALPEGGPGLVLSTATLHGGNPGGGPDHEALNPYPA